MRASLRKEARAALTAAFMDRPQDVAVYVEQLEQLERLAVFGLEAAAEFERIAQDYRQRPE